MALSGSFYKYAASSFGLYCEWSASQNVRENYSTVKLSIYESYYKECPGGTGTATVDDSTESVTYESAYNYAGSLKRNLAGTFEFLVYHDANGSKKVTLSATWTLEKAVDDGYVSVAKQTITASTTVTLDKIDRTEPTISVSLSNITMNSFKINASSNTTCDNWQFCIDDGAWIDIDAGEGTSAAVSISGITLNTTCSVKVQARKVSNYVYGSSTEKFVTTLGSSKLNYCNAFNADAATVIFKPNLTVYDSSVTHFFEFLNGTTSLFTTASKTFIAGTADYSVTLTAEQRSTLLAIMANSKSFEFTVKMTVYADSRLIGTETGKVTANTSADTSAPTFSDFSYKDVSTCVAITGSDQILIQEASDLLVNAVAATAKNGASIASYSAVIADKTVTSKTTAIAVGEVGSYGTLELTVSAIDTRGYSTSVKKSIKVLQYSKPKITEYILRRTNGVDEVIQLSFSGNISTLLPDGVTNVNGFVSVTYCMKGTNEDTYGDTVDITDLVGLTSDGKKFSFVTNQLMSLPVNKSYHFKIVVTDKVSDYELIAVIPQGTPLVSLRRDKVGINNPDPQYALDIVGDLNLTGNITINGVSLAKILGLEEGG